MSEFPPPARRKASKEAVFEGTSPRVGSPLARKMVRREPSFVEPGGAAALMMMDDNDGETPLNSPMISRPR
jgi:hypothetical protein